MKMLSLSDYRNLQNGLEKSGNTLTHARMRMLKNAASGYDFWKSIKQKKSHERKAGLEEKPFFGALRSVNFAGKAMSALRAEAGTANFSYRTGEATSCSSKKWDVVECVLHMYPFQIYYCFFHLSKCRDCWRQPFMIACTARRKSICRHVMRRDRHERNIARVSCKEVLCSHFCCHGWSTVPGKSIFVSMKSVDVVEVMA